jgi:hypothetical protein
MEPAFTLIILREVLLPICELWLASDSPGSLEEPFRFALEEGQKLVVRDRLWHDGRIVPAGVTEN